MSESLQDVLRRFGEQQMAAAQAAARSAGKALNATQADFVLSSEVSDTEAEEIRQRLMSADQQKPVILESEPMVKVALVPVEVFGAECQTCDEEVGYGLCDAVSAWSDCNRAIGRIYRRDDEATIPYRDPDHVITVWVPQSEMWKFDKRYGEGFTE